MRIYNPSVTPSNATIKSNRLKRISALFSHFLLNIAGAKASPEQLSTQPTKFFKSFSVNYDTQRQQKDQAGFLSHFGRYQEPALFIHGEERVSPDCKGIKYYKGITINDKNKAAEEVIYELLSVKEFIVRLKKDFNLDLHRKGNTGKGPLHLICCYSGDSNPDSIPGQLARELDRSVISYGDNMSLYLFGPIMENSGRDAQIYGKATYNNKKIYIPQREIIHHPDNQPGKIRE